MSRQNDGSIWQWSCREAHLFPSLTSLIRQFIWSQRGLAAHPRRDILPLRSATGQAIETRSLLCTRMCIGSAVPDHSCVLDLQSQIIAVYWICSFRSSLLCNSCALDLQSPFTSPRHDVSCCHSAVQSTRFDCSDITISRGSKLSDRD